MNPPEHITLPQDDEISLLDLLLVLAEHLRLLIIAPLVAGLLAVGISFAVPNTYQSTAILVGNQQLASRMTTPAVIDTVITELKLQQPDESLAQARQRLRGAIKASFNAKDSLVTINLEAKAPELAQLILNRLLGSLFEQGKPRGSERTRIQSLLKSTEERLKESSEIARKTEKRLLSNGIQATSDAAQGYATLIATIDGLEKKQQELLKELSGLDDSQLLQPPTLDKIKTSPKRALVAVITTLAVFFLLLLYVFVRSAWRNASASQETSIKVGQLQLLWRRAIGQT